MMLNACLVIKGTTFRVLVARALYQRISVLDCIVGTPINLCEPFEQLVISATIPTESRPRRCIHLLIGGFMRVGYDKA